MALLLPWGAGRGERYAHLRYTTRGGHNVAWLVVVVSVKISVGAVVLLCLRGEWGDTPRPLARGT